MAQTHSTGRVAGILERAQSRRARFRDRSSGQIGLQLALVASRRSCEACAFNRKMGNFALMHKQVLSKSPSKRNRASRSLRERFCYDGTMMFPAVRLSLAAKIRVIFTAGFLCVTLGSCSGFFINPTVSSIFISPAAATVAVGGTVQLTATATYSDGTQSTITSSSLGWSSSSTDATISSPGGLVTGVASGTATITATYQGVSGTATVTVSPQNVTSLCITTTEGSASCSQITATISGVGGPALPFFAYANGSPLNDVTTAVSWSSSNTNVATITTGIGTGSGEATSVSAGTTNITATITNTTTNQLVSSQTILLTVQ